MTSKNKELPVKKNAFVHKLYLMLQDQSLHHLIWWSEDNPDHNTFALQPGTEFATALKGYFKHGNVALFVRQLHMYGFHKVLEPSSSSLAADEDDKEHPPVWEFRHSSGRFKKDDEQSLVFIKRRSSLNTQRGAYDQPPPSQTPQSLYYPMVTPTVAYYDPLMGYRPQYYYPMQAMNQMQGMVMGQPGQPGQPMMVPPGQMYSQVPVAYQGQMPPSLVPPSLVVQGNPRPQALSMTGGAMPGTTVPQPATIPQQPLSQQSAQPPSQLTALPPPGTVISGQPIASTTSAPSQLLPPQPTTAPPPPPPAPTPPAIPTPPQPVSAHPSAHPSYPMPPAVGSPGPHHYSVSGAISSPLAPQPPPLVSHHSAPASAPHFRKIWHLGETQQRRRNPSLLYDPLAPAPPPTSSAPALAPPGHHTIQRGPSQLLLVPEKPGSLSSDSSAALVPSQAVPVPIPHLPPHPHLPLIVDHGLPLLVDLRNSSLASVRHLMDLRSSLASPRPLGLGLVKLPPPLVLRLALFKFLDRQERPELPPPPRQKLQPMIRPSLVELHLKQHLMMLVAGLIDLSMGSSHHNLLFSNKLSLLLLLLARRTLSINPEFFDAPERSDTVLPGTGPSPPKLRLSTVPVTSLLEEEPSIKRAKTE